MEYTGGVHLTATAPHWSGEKMTELRDIFAKMAEEDSAEICPVGRLISSFDEETRQAFLRVMASPASTRDIHSELAKAGFKIGRDTLGTHRSNWCRCKGYEINDKKQ